MARSNSQAARPKNAKPHPGARLGDVLASITVIDVVCAPRGLDVPVGPTIIYDPASPPPLEEAAVVLGVGVPSESDEAVELVSSVARAGGAAVALRVAGEAATRLGDVSERTGVAVLGLPAEMTWSQAVSLLRTAAADFVDPDTTGLPLGDLFALANAVGAMVGGAVTIEDRHSRVLAYSSQGEAIDEPRRQTILGQRVPDEWLQRLEEEGVFRRLWAGELVRYRSDEDPDLRPRLAVAVRAGDTILGSIWVAEGDKPLGDAAEEALREAARIAALHMIRHRAGDDLARSVRGDVLLSILEGEGSSDALAYRLGVPANGTFAVLAFQPEESDEVSGALSLERSGDLVALYGEAFRHRSAVVQLDRTIYMLLPGPDVARPQRLVALARDIVERARDTLEVRLHAGIGSIVSHLREVPRSRREADQVLRALSAEDRSVCVSDFASARGRIALLELGDFASDRPHLRSAPLEVLMKHDAERGTDYVETLRTYFDAFGDVPRAAKKANVHPNTFRYRLRRLIALSGLDLSDPDQRLLVELDLRLRSNGKATP